MKDADTLKFRGRYREGISPLYNGHLHVAFVYSLGAVALGSLFLQLTDVSLWEWLVYPFTLVIWNFIEYTVHKQLGHKKRRLAKLFYKRHSGDHHTFYTDTYLTPRDSQDWRVTFFPAWLIVVVLFLAGGTAWLLYLLGGSANASLLLMAGLLSGYLMYETIHYCDHLPSDHVICQLPWLGHMRHLHRLHHRRDMMHERNFNLTFPLADWVLGTFYWEAPESLEQEQREA